MMEDRNFDDLAERFAKRIHGSAKGDIRRSVIWRDLDKVIPAIKQSPGLTVIDMGAGIGQFAIDMAILNHQVTANDISENMLVQAKALALKNNVDAAIQWQQIPYQQLPKVTQQSFDIILCHALLEWLAKPEELLPTIATMIKPGGVLSLCFYNPAGLVYRNLICGNFRYIDKLSTTKADHGSLTPQNPSSLEQVEAWLDEQGFTIKQLSGIRVFSDYVLEKRGGNLENNAIIEKELEYSDKEPFRRIGRYLHIVAEKNTSS